MAAVTSEPGRGVAGAPFLKLEAIGKAFGNLVVLDDVSLALAEGEVLALLGPSGSGKTTLLRILAGFEAPDRGLVRVGGEEVTRRPPSRRGFGMVFQHYALFPHLDVGGNVAFGLEGRERSRAARAERVREVLELVDLGGFEARAITELSGGQQQRVAVARALAPSPRLLLLDEPLSNLDPALRERTRRALKELVRRIGITTVLVTHEQQEAFDLGDRVALLWQGRLQQVGSPPELYERPANRFVASFVGRANLIPGRFVAGDRPGVAIAAGGGPVWEGEPVGSLADGAPAELMLRPEGLALAEAGAGSAPGVVVERLYLGGAWLVRVRLEGGPEVDVRAGSPAPAPGEPVAVAPQPGAARGRIWAREEAADRTP